MAWIDALAETELAAKGKAVVRHEGRQILVLATGTGLYACANRCPHEGYPLSEGVVSGGCVLTCNWHNWKFELETGETLVGGDRLVRYPAERRGGRIWLDVSPPDPAVRKREVLANLEVALGDEDQPRLVREVARLGRLGADPLDGVRTAIRWAADRLELGTTHAVAGAPDWLALYDAAEPGSAEALAALGEILGHLAEDARGGRRRPPPTGAAPWSEAEFLAAIEREDEDTAITLLRGALADGLDEAAVAPALFRAALAHYADFGHSLIYAAKTLELVRRLGPSVAEPLLVLLARSLVLATREDLLPEFRTYAARHAAWGRADGIAPPLEPAALRRSTPKSAMGVVAGWGARHPPEAVFAVLVEAAAWTLLHVDEAALSRVDARLADTVSWLDFTHALTFAEAAEAAATVAPDLWPAILLQLACFIGRNAAYVDPGTDTQPYRVDDVERFVATRTRSLLDHGRDRFIISVHLLKTLRAGSRLLHAVPAAAPVIAAALKRFLDAPMKGRHVLRTARQMRELVEAE